MQKGVSSKGEKGSGFHRTATLADDGKRWYSDGHCIFALRQHLMKGFAWKGERLGVVPDRNLTDDGKRWYSDGRRSQ